jgi:hypothetical protein
MNAMPMIKIFSSVHLSLNENIFAIAPINENIH